MKYYIKVEKDVKILVEDINFDLGNPIMFVHGWTLNHNMYEYIVEYFASRGHSDTICPYPFAEYMNRTIKNSVLTPLTDGGHGAFYECKDEINKSLEAFIYNYLQ